jgi:alkanesulfonate monooxygenase SsuD/methylene tetrahydromethanopterin reductase-like flavin-dependent oxidoreductase (luciferase family)
VKFCTGCVWVDPAQYVELARSAETCGWDGIVLSDHLIHPEQIQSRYPYSENGEPPWQGGGPVPDVWVSIGADATPLQAKGDARERFADEVIARMR